MLPNWSEHPEKVFLTKKFCLPEKNSFPSRNVNEVPELILIDDVIDLMEGYSCYFLIKFQAVSLQ